MVRTMSLVNAFMGPSRYHSMSAMGVGAWLRLISVTLPLLNRMRRSAMGASAELCVMMMTVMPSRRQVSCKSCRICLPVW